MGYGNVNLEIEITIARFFQFKHLEVKEWLIKDLPMKK